MPLWLSECPCGYRCFPGHRVHRTVGAGRLGLCGTLPCAAWCDTEIQWAVKHQVTSYQGREIASLLITGMWTEHSCFLELVMRRYIQLPYEISRRPFKTWEQVLFYAETVISESLRLFNCISWLIFPKDRDLWFHGSFLFHSVLEPALWVLAEEVQKQQRVAETVGRLHQLLPVLLQNAPGEPT